VPFYIFYSMFGFQRVGDLIWQAADSRTRGFLLGATAGRTTLMGEGLQHQDGHSLLLASTVPACQAYDPAFAYEVAAIVKDGLTRMYGPEPQDIFYYLTLYNENYAMPPRPASPTIDADINRGLYLWNQATAGTHRASILFSGSAHTAARAAAAELLERYDVGVDLWSATSYKLLREEGLDTERWNRLHPTETARVPLVTRLLGETRGPIVAVSDFMRSVPAQVAPYLSGKSFTVLGTDGMGRSDTREALRRYFEVDMAHIVVAVLHQFALAGDLPPSVVADAIDRYGIDPDSTSSLHT
jgi:pyruvate dehydrogenase E1 component